MKPKIPPSLLLLFIPFGLFSQSAGFEKKIQAKLDSFCVAGKFPGISIGIALPGNNIFAFVSGFADVAKGSKMKTSDCLMQGSVGKTYVSAIVLQLVREGKIDLNEKVATYLGDRSWFNKLPNASTITIKMLMTHTSGIMRYEFKDAFTKDLTEHPDKVWKPEELLAYVFDEKAAFPAGAGWDYSDTNYILLGMIMEKLTGQTYYALLENRLLKPFGLSETHPSDKRILPGLVQGYAGNENSFGNKNKVIEADGKFIINPQFEWTGGGLYSTSRDLAKWAKIAYEGKAFDPSLLPIMLEGVPSPMLGGNTKYGLGVIIRESQTLGTFYGHSGFFPGYLAEVYYFPKQRFTIALLTNSSDFKSLKIYDLKVLVEIANVVAKGTE
jgi:D-alanyl-D-alanine carboxypeptidase